VLSGSFQNKYKNVLKGKRFADIPDIKCNKTLLQGTAEMNYQDSSPGTGTIILQSA
jgi:hypothetical protein